MDEFERLRRSLPIPEEDEGAKERALARLDAAIEKEAVRTRPTRLRPGRGRRWTRRASLLTGVAAALTVILLIVQALLPSKQGGPPPSAAEELQRLGALAGAGPVIEPGDGYLYTQLEQDIINSNSELGGASWDFRVRERLETWAAADGSGRRVVTVESVSFVSDADRAAWIDAGRPERPQVGQTVEHYDPGGLLRYDVASLPADPDTLRTLIHSGKVLDVSSGTFGTFYGIGELLLQPDTPPAARMGLFDLASVTPGITSGSVTDPLGRSGEAFAIERTTETRTLIVDPNTAQALAVIFQGAEGTSWTVLVQTAGVPTATSQP